MKLVSVKKIERNPYQPRDDIEKETIREMIASVKRHGLLQPIIVRKVNEGYQIAAGERRYQAAMEAGMTEVPVIERDMTDKEMLEIALIENVHREEMSPIEKARGFKRLMGEFKMTQGEVARIFGMSRPAVANTIRLLDLPEEVALALKRKEITEGHARTVLGINNKEAVKTLLCYIKEKKISVRECEEIVRKIGRKREKGKGEGETQAKRKEYERILTEIFRTKVKVKVENGKGTIEIEIYSREDIERIIDQLKG